LKHDRPKQAGKRSWKLFGWSFALLALMGIAWLYSVLSEVGLDGLLRHPATPVSKISLARQNVYQIKKKQEVLGINVLRIVSRQQPEEFLVLEGVSRGLVDKIYGKHPDLVWANMMANQLIKLRQAGEDGSPVSVDVQGVKTLKSGTIQQKKKTYPYWQLEVQFKLSNESVPRAYDAAIIRNIQPEQTKSGKDTLLVGYAQKEAFQKELVADLMSNLRFEQN
jgi:hypothetical protein